MLRLLDSIYQVTKIDGRVIGDGKVGPVTRQLQEAYKKLTENSGVPIPTYQETWIMIPLEEGMISPLSFDS